MERVTYSGAQMGQHMGVAFSTLLLLTYSAIFMQAIYLPGLLTLLRQVQNRGSFLIYVKARKSRDLGLHVEPLADCGVYSVTVTHTQ